MVIPKGLCDRQTFGVGQLKIPSVRFRHNIQHLQTKRDSTTDSHCTKHKHSETTSIVHLICKFTSPQEYQHPVQSGPWA